MTSPIPLPEPAGPAPMESKAPRKSQGTFVRLLRLIVRHPGGLFATVGLSLLIAVLWGGNIGAMYPIIEVAFRGESIHDWLDDELQESRDKQVSLREEIEALRQREGAGPPSHERKALEQRLAAEARAVELGTRYRPWVDRYLTRDPYQTILLIVGLLLVATLIKNIAAVAQSMANFSLARKVEMDVRRQFFNGVMAMDPVTYRMFGASQLTTIYNDVVNGIGAGVQALIGSAVREPLKIIACGFGAAWISWRLMLLMFALYIPTLLILRVLGRKMRKEISSRMQDQELVNQLVLESFQGLPSVQANTREADQSARVERANFLRWKKGMRVNFWNSLARPTSELLGLAAIGGGLLIGAYIVLCQETHILGFKVCDRPLSPAGLMVFYAMLVGMAEPGKKLADVFAAIQRALAAAEWLFRAMDVPAQIVNPEHPQPVPEGSGLGSSVELRNVEYGYETGGKVLHGVTVTIEPGQTVALVGPNGCGKSTLARLLPRFCDPSTGEVRINGRDVRELDLHDLRNHVGIVSQHDFLMADTVAANIRFGSPEATQEQVEEAARLAHASEFIEQLEDGYETESGPDGSRLSGGQRQRVLLARAVLRAPQVVILDEFTSQIDALSEQNILRSLEPFLRTRTALIISHRVSTLECVDRVLFLIDGRLEGDGPHRELLHRCPAYRSFWADQSREAA